MSQLLYTNDIAAELPAYIEGKSFSQFFLLADQHTFELCFPIIKDNFSEDLTAIIVPPGEASKTLVQVEVIWQTLLKYGADRSSLLINLGGGVVTDMGAFAASVYKRGIPFIHLPTSLLAMVDAAVGGKTGVDYMGLKNMLGTFSPADAVMIYPPFLQSLQERELKAGFAEVLKYALIRDAAFWKYVKGETAQSIQDWKSIIQHCLDIKEAIVQEDPQEKGLRKILNFGHTIGHALESYSLEHDAEPLLHGEAVAAGMVMEAYLSQMKTGLPEAEATDIQKTIFAQYSPYAFEAGQYNDLLERMRQDKKNASGDIRFALLEETGRCTYDISCSEAEIMLAFDHYRSAWNG